MHGTTGAMGRGRVCVPWHFVGRNGDLMEVATEIGKALNVCLHGVGVGGELQQFHVAAALIR